MIIIASETGYKKSAKNATMSLYMHVSSKVGTSNHWLQKNGL